MSELERFLGHWRLVPERARYEWGEPYTNVLWYVK
jgi:hypothetical protein